MSKVCLDKLSELLKFSSTTFFDHKAAAAPAKVPNVKKQRRSNFAAAKLKYFNVHMSN